MTAGFRSYQDLDEIGKMARGLHRSLANRRGEEGKQ
jgi:hypothetical protein